MATVTVSRLNQLQPTHLPAHTHNTHTHTRRAQDTKMMIPHRRYPAMSVLVLRVRPLKLSVAGLSSGRAGKMRVISSENVYAPTAWKWSMQSVAVSTMAYAMRVSNGLRNILVNVEKQWPSSRARCGCRGLRWVSVAAPASKAFCRSPAAREAIVVARKVVEVGWVLADEY